MPTFRVSCKTDAAPEYDSGAHATFIDGPVDISVVRIECNEIYAVHAMFMYPEIESRVRTLGPALFLYRPIQLFVRALLRGELLDLSTLTGRECRTLGAFQRELDICTLNPDLVWANRVIDILAQDRHRELLIAELGWAAEQLRAGTKIDWIEVKVGHAFDIAMGRVPAGPAGWEAIAA